MQTIEDRTVLQAWVPRSFAQRVREHADAAERSVSAEVRLALRELLVNDERRPGEGGVVQESGKPSRHGAV